MKNKKVFIPGPFTHEAAESLFAEEPGVELIWAFPETGRTWASADYSAFDDPVAEARRRLEEHLGTIHALSAMGPRGPLIVDAEMMDRAPNLEVVFIQAAGADTVDMEAATERGIVVLNAPGANAPAVAEHAVALMLSLARFVTFSDRLAHTEKRSDPKAVYDAPVPPSLLRGKTLGLVGFGHIGRTVATMMRAAFSMEILVHDPYGDPEAMERMGARAVDLEELLERSDVVTLHAALTDSTHRIIDSSALARMQPHAYLINTSRGPLVDTDALTHALVERRIAGAGLDVTDPEPLPAGHRLFDLPNVVLTPHIASQCAEAQEATARISTELVLEALRGRMPASVMNPSARPRAQMP